MANFDELGLPKTIVKRLMDKGLTEPTPIQNRAIPHALNGQDVMGLAQTGTGKTLAFGLPLIAKLSDYGTKPAAKSVRGLVLAPTRELANQIAASLKEIVDGTPFKVGLVVGGVSINPQISRVSRGTDVIVATPGRLIDLIERNAIEFGETDFLVLDEADQMLDLGFIHALRRIADILPKERQTMLFSATMPKQMNEIAQSYLNNPVRIQVSPPGKAADKIEQSIHFISKAEKMSLLKELLADHRDEAAIVFARTKHGAEKMKKTLEASGFPAASVHGNKSQGQRERAIAQFKSGEAMVLVATDVAARGLDIPHVRHVYNYDLPNVPDNYVHRIGRTARAGQDGAAIAFCAPDEIELLNDIEKTMKVSIPVASGRAWMGYKEPGKKPGKGRGKPGGKPAGKAGGNRRGGSGRGRAKPADSQSDFGPDVETQVFERPRADKPRFDRSKDARNQSGKRRKPRGEGGESAAGFKGNEGDAKARADKPNRGKPNSGKFAKPSGKAGGGRPRGKPQGKGAPRQGGNDAPRRRG